MRILVLAILVISWNLVAMQESQEDYSSLTADTKQNMLWHKIKTSEWLSYPFLVNPHSLNLMAIIDKLKSLNISSSINDETSQERNNYLFAYGSVAKIEYKPTSKIFSGIFRSGAIGFAYFSVLADPDALDCFIPKISFKFLIDDSLSLHAQVFTSWDGHNKNGNWFTHNMSNIPLSPQSMQSKILALIYDDPAQWSINHLAERSRNGRLSFEVYSPEQIILVPTTEAKESIEHASIKDFRYDLGQILPNTILYEVYARVRPSDAFEEIGKIVLRSECISSRFADKNLTF